MMASEMLTKLRDDPNFWMNTDKIVEHSNNKQCKFFALMILQETVKVNFHSSISG